MVMQLSQKNSAVDPSGRVLVPSDWRTSLGLAPGTEVILVKHTGSIEIMTREEVHRRVRAFGASLASPGVSVVDELIQERRDEARREYGGG